MGMGHRLVTTGLLITILYVLADISCFLRGIELVIPEGISALITIILLISMLSEDG